MKTRLATGFVLLLGAALGAAPGCAAFNVPAQPATVVYNATYPHYTSLDDMAQSAGMVVRGTMLSSTVQAIDVSAAPTSDDPSANPGGSPAGDGTFVYTVFSFQVSDCYKGDAQPGETIQFRQLGGTLDNVTYVFAQADPFTDGGRYILFLDTYPSLPATLVNPGQGAYAGDADAAGNFDSVSPGGWSITAGQLQDLSGH